MFFSLLDVLRRVDQILQTVDGQSQAQNQTSGPTSPSFQFQGIVNSESVFFPSDDYCSRYLCIYQTYYVAFVDKLDFVILLSSMHNYVAVRNKCALDCVCHYVTPTVRPHLIDCNTGVINT
jgi:hypothetical protein